MYEVISGLPPYSNIAHDKPLALYICQGGRPKFNIKVPQLILHLIKRCLDANPLNRLTALEVGEIFNKWCIDIYDYITELYKQIKKAEEINNSLLNNRISSTSLNLTYKTHSEVIYTSRLLYFNNLPKPRNSDDYYKQYDDISIMKYSDIL